MQMPTVTEITDLSAHRRQMELVRLSLMAVPERNVSPRAADPRDPLRSMDSASLQSERARN